MIFKNKNPSGKLWNILFGLAQFVDALVRILSLGYFCTNYCVTVSRHMTQYHINNLKKKRAQNEYARVNQTRENNSDNTRNDR